MSCHGGSVQAESFGQKRPWKWKTLTKCELRLKPQYLLFSCVQSFDTAYTAQNQLKIIKVFIELLLSNCSYLHILSKYLVLVSRKK